jgi:hypothetical protein
MGEEPVDLLVLPLSCCYLLCFPLSWWKLSTGSGGLGSPTAAPCRSIKRRKKVLGEANAQPDGEEIPGKEEKHKNPLD